MEDWKKRLGSYDSLDEAIFVTIDEETIYTIDKLVDFIEQEISKAREEGMKGKVFTKVELVVLYNLLAEPFDNELMDGKLDGGLYGKIRDKIDNLLKEDK